MKLVSIVGARPQFIKLAPFERVIKNNTESLSNVIINTGQHYDKDMSDIFFNELKITAPKYNLGVGSGSHAEQTGKAMEAIEKILIDERPDYTVVFGDTNATLSGTLASAKLGVPVAHIEAGLRSNNRKMPEEINRIVVDRISHKLFCPNTESAQNLQSENCFGEIYCVGDIMVDQIYYIKKIGFSKTIVPNEPFVFITLHRQETSFNLEKIKNLLHRIGKLANGVQCVFSVHPRMKSFVESISSTLSNNFCFIKPLGYMDAIQHIEKALCVFTDSGGIQKEAYILKTPCITLREETEWHDTLQNSWNTLVGFDSEKLENAFKQVSRITEGTPHFPCYGSGDSASKIIGGLLGA